ncbi:Hsp20/alpha crystallin family protein [Haloferula sp. BvORR071]|uniref:Hsp20/alpha crystallin family protein n=1 Tax=Haloferula sp. BvORR071 TaxID=1396141 RepID=UPI00054F1642|nr:Hsp20/alpha crystallin family protein [Haloferula sp. BvORR071]
MNAIIRWNPIRDLADVHGSLSSILGRSTRNHVSSQGEISPAPDWVPVVDIAENESGYLLKIEIPGVREDDVSVKIDDRLLTVTGERKPEAGEGVRHLLMERASGTFARAFKLADSVDPESVEARFRNGVLEIHVAKLEATKPRVIQIKSE